VRGLSPDLAEKQKTPSRNRNYAEGKHRPASHRAGCRLKKKKKTGGKKRNKRPCLAPVAKKKFCLPGGRVWMESRRNYRGRNTLWKGKSKINGPGGKGKSAGTSERLLG